MGDNDNRGEQEQTASDDDDGGLSRRSVLKTSSTAAVGAVGFEAVTGSARADDYSEEEEDDLELGLLECTGGWANPDWFRVVDLDPPWWEGDYDRNFYVSDLSDEICIYIHGFLSSPQDEEQAATLRNNIDFDGDVIAAKWPSVTPTYTEAWDRAETYGRKLAEWLMDVLWYWTDVEVNVVGHSLGGRASFNFLNRLEEDPYYNDLVNNVVTVGPADHVRFVCDRNESGDRIYNYYSAINSVPDNAYVFHSNEDFAVGDLHELWGSDLLWYTPNGDGLGARGVTCSNAPANLESVDVTGTVGNHCEYFKSDGADDRVSQAVNGTL